MYKQITIQTRKLAIQIVLFVFYINLNEVILKQLDIKTILLPNKIGLIISDDIFIIPPSNLVLGTLLILASVYSNQVLL